MYRLRLRLAKRGHLRFISHLETMQALTRAARRANLPLAVTEGFNPRPKISWGPPLAVGLTSEAEYLDFFLARFVPAMEALKLLNRALPEDLFLLEGKYVLPKSQSLGGMIDVAIYEGEVVLKSELNSDEPKKLAGILLAQKSLEVKRRDKIKKVDLTKALLHLEVHELHTNSDELHLDMTLSVKEESLRPDEVIKAFFDLFPRTLSYEIKRITRTGLFAKKGSNFVDPIVCGCS